MEEIITFEELREVFISEKNDSKLTKIDENFFSKVKNYLEFKEKAFEQTKNEKILQELKSAKRMFEEIILTRQKKIINSVFVFLKTGALPENMLNSEEEIFFKIVDLLKEYRQKLISGSQEIKKQEVKKVKIKMLFDIPEFIGPDGKEYGPFKQDEIVEIEEEVAKYLIENGFAKTI
ncbi:MAG: hypothetical protein QXQ14_00910 [Candidatus Aenigmatarchaeota archaeon]